MAYPRMAMAALPYARLELPGWGTVLRHAGVFDSHRWLGAPVRRTRGKWHGFTVELDLSNWSERQTYFLGRFYELPIQLLLKSALRQGETFIDVGANIGMLTLLAARRVGPNGTVHAFEPNPMCLHRLNSTLQRNHLRNVIVHACGLSDQDQELSLSVLTDNSGMGTFADIPADQQEHITGVFRVPVRRGDDELPTDLDAPVFLKIDVEGFECRVLRGLCRTLDRLKSAVAMEALPGHLERAGSSLAELFDLMLEHGYRPYALGARRETLQFHLVLSQLSGPDELGDSNMVWLHPDGPHLGRLSPWMS